MLETHKFKQIYADTQTVPKSLPPSEKANLAKYFKAKQFHNRDGNKWREEN